MSAFTLGTRGSALALWQTNHVAGLLRAADPSLEVKVEIITTRGDVDQSDRLVGKLEKGFFTEELERALRDGAIDAAVHSLKDLPTRLPEGLALGAVLERARSNDVLLVRPDWVKKTSDAVLPLADPARVGASSLRRDALLRRYAPTCQPVPLRGNVPTRVERLREGRTDAIVLASAGLDRLKLDLSGLAVFRLNPRRWVPAPGQGAIGVQCRESDGRAKTLLLSAHHQATAHATGWERDFLRVLEGGCATPFGAMVEGQRAFLGQATKSGWRARSVALPEAAGEAERSKFIQQVLAEEMEGDGDDGGWLFESV
jgi:hydroxymethylbilane synthase